MIAALHNGHKCRRRRSVSSARTPDGAGYYKVRIGDKQVREHVAVAETILGRALPVGAQVHHADHDRSNNEPANLVICPSDSYHKLLHQRARALAECGNASWLKCWVCKTYSPAGEIVTHGKNTHHRACINQWQRAAYKRRKACRTN